MNIMRSNEPETSALLTDINKLTHTTQTKLTQRVHFCEGKEKAVSAENSWLKRLLVGTAILTSAGVLTLGSYRAVMGRATKQITSQSTQPPATPLTLPEGLPTTKNHFQEAADIHSPYSYYEAIYGGRMAQNKGRVAERMQRPAIVAAESLVSEELTITAPDTLAIKYNHDDEREFYYKTIINDTYSEPGRRYHYELAYLCGSYLKYVITDACHADPESRCELLGMLVDKIGQYKFNDSSLREINNEKENLSPDDYIDEMIARRKLLAAYLAAEYIIERKNRSNFYTTVMMDNKNYSAEDFVKREKRIMSYFPQHYAMGQCRHPGQMISG